MLTINPKIFTKASLFLLSLLLSATLWAQDIHQLKTLANKGDSEAQFELGVIYDNGDQLPQDLKKAAYWYTKSAQQGHVDAQYNIGDMYHLAMVSLKIMSKPCNGYQKPLIEAQ